MGWVGVGGGGWGWESPVGKFVHWNFSNCSRTSLKFIKPRRLLCSATVGCPRAKIESFRREIQLKIHETSPMPMRGYRITLDLICEFFKCTENRTLPTLAPECEFHFLRFQCTKTQLYIIQYVYYCFNDVVKLIVYII